MKIVIVSLVIVVWIALVNLVLSRKLRPKKSIREVARKSSFIDKLIEESGVLNKAKFYSSIIHIILSLFMFMTSYSFSRVILGTFSSLIFSILFATIPTIVLSVKKQNKTSDTRVEAVNFIEIFSNNIIVQTNIFEAMRSSLELCREPVKKVVKKSLAMYDNKIDPVICIRYIEKNLSGVEVKSFFNSLEYHFIEGGDISRVNESSIDDLTMIIEIDQTESSDDSVMFTMLYAMIVINVVMVLISLLSPYAKYITKTVYGEVALSINFLICISILIGTFIKQGDVS